MKKIIFIVLLWVSFAQVFAQDSLQKTKKWEVGLGANQIVNLDYSTTGIFVKRHLPNNRALRLIFDFSYENTKNASLSGYLGNNNSFESHLNLGYEWQKPFGKFQIFYGIDLSILNTKGQEERYQYISFAKISSQSFSRFQIGYSGLLGIKYFIHPRWSISAESRVSHYYWEQISQIDYYVNNVFDHTEHIAHFSNFLTFLNVSVFYFSYYF